MKSYSRIPVTNNGYYHPRNGVTDTLLSPNILMTMKKLSISPTTAGLFLSLMLWMSVIVAKQDTPKIQSTNQEKVNVSISKWEYCEGCKETVNLYTRVLSNKLLSMHNGGVKAHSELIAEDLVNGICDSEDLVKYKDFVKYSCIKIMDNHNSVFLKQFEGTSSPTNVLNKALVFERKKHVCPSNLNNFFQLGFLLITLPFIDLFSR